ncbi:MAG: aldo/keto reductase [Promethearchaeota archaeon]
MQLSMDSKIKLNNDVEIPLLGLGTWNLFGNDAYNAVLWALDLGYRLIDTAMIYNNERDVGKALKDTQIPRDEIFVTTKVWNTDQGYKSTLKAFEKSLKRLNVEFVDLYLIHWPATHLRNETWKALEKIYQDGKARSIGVSNYTIRHLNELLRITNTIPAVNQFELSPFLFQKDLIDYCNERKIAVEAYSPLTRGRKFDNELLQSLGKKYNKSSAQILIRWGIQQNFIEIPKSGNKEHLKENADIFDFSLDNEDMINLNNLSNDYRIGEDPHLID